MRTVTKYSPSGFPIKIIVHEEEDIHLKNTPISLDTLPHFSIDSIKNCIFYHLKHVKIEPNTINSIFIEVPSTYMRFLNYKNIYVKIHIDNHMISLYVNPSENTLENNFHISTYSDSSRDNLKSFALYSGILNKLHK